MATDKFLILSVIIAMVLPSLTMATQYTVGDDKGWTVDHDYTEWVKDKVFRVGDTLVFNYNRQNHNVFKVNQTSFASCTVPPLNDAMNTGHDVVPLLTPGKKWYICGVQGHCGRNQKLVINVMDAWAPAPAPTSDAHTTNIIHQMYVVIVAAVVLMAVF